jgi:LuxR family maltose regulon positive regulatory protein
LPRAHLIQRLNEAFNQPEQPELGFFRRLTLVCAPAGFGKTTVIDLWLRSFPQRAANQHPSVFRMAITPESGSDPNLFAASLSESLRRVAVDAGWEMPITGMPLQPVLTNRLLAALDSHQSGYP